MKVMQNYEDYQSYPLQENIGNSLFLSIETDSSIKNTQYPLRDLERVVLTLMTLREYINPSIPIDKIFPSDPIDNYISDYYEKRIVDEESIPNELYVLFSVPKPLGEYILKNKVETFNWDPENEDDYRDDHKNDYINFGPYYIIRGGLYQKNLKLDEGLGNIRRRKELLYSLYNEVYLPISGDILYLIEQFINLMKKVREGFIKEYLKKDNINENYYRRKSFKMFKEGIEIERGTKEVIAKVTGKESEIFTKIGKRLLEIEEAERRIKELKEEVKDTIRNEKILEIFDQAEDKLKTRKIQTLSLILTISKDPAPRKTVAYKQVLDELLEMFPELVEKYNELVEKYTTITQLEPTVKATPFFKESEENTGFFAKIKNWFVRVFDNWLKKYDMKLKRLQKKVESLKTTEKEE